MLATDISAGILALAQRRFGQAGLANAATRVMDGEDLAVEEGHYDAVISRLGLIYLPDRAGALGSALRALRPGGRIAAVVYAAAPDNGFSPCRCRSSGSAPDSGGGTTPPGDLTCGSAGREYSSVTAKATRLDTPACSALPRAAAITSASRSKPSTLTRV